MKLGLSILVLFIICYLLNYVSINAIFSHELASFEVVIIDNSHVHKHLHITEQRYLTENSLPALWYPALISLHSIRMKLVLVLPLLFLASITLTRRPGDRVLWQGGRKKGETIVCPGSRVVVVVVAHRRSLVGQFLQCSHCSIHWQKRCQEWWEPGRDSVSLLSGCLSERPRWGNQCILKHIIYILHY